MKSTYLNHILILLICLLIGILFPIFGFSENNTQFGLPFGVKACLGKGFINDIAFYPDSMKLAIASDSGIWKYNINTGIETIISKDWIEMLELSEDGTILASVESFWDAFGFRPTSDKIQLLDTDTGSTSLISTEHRDGIKSIGLSPDGRTLASGGEGTIQLWDTDTGRFLFLLRGHTDTVRKLVFSNDGKLLASGGADMTIRLWNVQSRRQLLSIATEYTGSGFPFCFSSDGKTLVSGNQEGIIHLWDTRTGRIRSTLKGHTDAVISLAYSPNGKTLASSSLDYTIRLWNIRSGREFLKIRTQPEGVYRLVFSPNGMILASASIDKTIRLWDTTNGRQLSYNFTGHWGPVTTLAFSHHGNTLVSAGGDWDKKVYLWNANTGKHQFTLQGHNSNSKIFAFSKDDKNLACGYEDGTILLWNAVSGQLLSTLTEHKSIDRSSTYTSIDTLTFSPNGKILAGASSEKTVLWDLESSVSLHTYVHKYLDSSIRALTFSVDATTLASIDSWRNLRIIEVSTGRLLRSIYLEDRETSKFMFSPHGTSLLGFPDRWSAKIMFWDMRTGDFLKSIPLVQSANSTSNANRWTISMDWTTIIGSDPSSFDTFYVWDARTGTRMSSIKSDWHHDITMALSPDGSILATGYSNGTILLRNIRD